MDFIKTRILGIPILIVVFFVLIAIIIGNNQITKIKSECHIKYENIAVTEYRPGNSNCIYPPDSYDMEENKQDCYEKNNNLRDLSSQAKLELSKKLYDLGIRNLNVDNQEDVACYVDYYIRKSPTYYTIITPYVGCFTRDFYKVDTITSTATISPYTQNSIYLKVRNVFCPQSM